MNDLLASHELLIAMQGFHGTDDRAQALETARAAWARRHGGEPLEGDDLAELGEAWRFAMLAATRDGERPERLVWRVRALSAFVRSGCRNGAAMLCLPSFFDAASDQRASTEEVLAILDATSSLADPDDGGPVPAAVIVSSVAEKRGYYLAQAARANPDALAKAHGFAEALTAYTAALSVEKLPRRQVKIRAASITVEYLSANSYDGREAARDRLAAILARIDSEGIEAKDVLRTGRNNLKVMAAGGADLEPYEIL